MAERTLPDISQPQGKTGGTLMDHPVVPLGSRHFSLRTMGLFSRLLASLRLLLHLKTPLEGSDAPSRTTGAPDQSELFPLEIGQSPSIDPGPLCKHLAGLVRHLRSPLLASCEWLEQGALEFVGGRPIDAGGVADIWIGEMNNRKVAIKVYRCYSSSNNFPTYVVSGAYLWRVGSLKGHR